MEKRDHPQLLLTAHDSKLNKRLTSEEVAAASVLKHSQSLQDCVLGIVFDLDSDDSFDGFAPGKKKKQLKGSTHLIKIGLILFRLCLFNLNQINSIKINVARR